MVTLVTAIVVAGLVIWLAAYMLAQKPQTSSQNLIQQHRYDAALSEAERLVEKRPTDTGARLHRAEAAKLIGRFDLALQSYRDLLRLDHADGAAHEGIALSLTYLQREPQEARRMMEEAVQTYPQIQEFQALALAFILLRQGRREEAMRLYEDNKILLETRFRDDYTDPDPFLAETLFHYAELARADGDQTRARSLGAQVQNWAPGSVFANWSREIEK